VTTILSRDLIGRFAARKRAEPDITLPSWPEDLTVLAFDADPAIRLTPASDHRTEDRILARLTSDPDARVRAAAAENPATPLVDAARVLRDPDPGAREAATRRLRSEGLEPGEVNTAWPVLRYYGGEPF
jgi:hypothetical protein